VARKLIAYKFLAAGAVAPFTGFRWRPEVWVEATDVQPCSNGIHACRPEHLPMWLAAELWEIELDGEIVEGERKLVAQRARLMQPIDQWTPELAREFGLFCARRTRRRVGFLPVVGGYVADVERFVAQNRIPLAAFAAARAAEFRNGPAGYDAERLVQAAWLAEQLGLEEP
jgi:hypothetical protein